MAHVFISYAPENFEFADLLVRWLERYGFTPWIDSASEEMPAGKDWRQEIDDAIRDAFALIVLMSPDSRSFEYVTYEWTFALGVGVKVIPLIVDATELPPRLKALPHFEFTNRGAYPWHRLLAALNEIFTEYQFTKRNLPQMASTDVRQLVSDLDTNDPARLQSAVEGLSKLDDWAARESLVAVLRHPTKTVRTAVALTLANSGDVRTIPNLIEAMRDSSKEIQWA
ncbi:MAG: toll/interleukin-1 receptor domain-containing protein, partial [Anaerolineae bacterium]|nr:toll/interleukin-1 receptor domain-containing protein [Anaerolineae bacterium]